MRSKVFCQLAALMFIFSISCKEKEKIGLQVQPDGQIGVVFADVALSTEVVLLNDSIVTSDAGLLLTGAYGGLNKDVQFGTTTAKAYTQVVQASENKDLSGFKDVKSVVLNLNYSYYYGDTSAAQTINVFELKKELSTASVYKNNDYTFAGYLGEQFDKNEEFSATPGKKGYNVKINLKETFGESILGIIGSGKSNTDFKAAFKGIALIPTNANGAILGLFVTGNGNRITIYCKNASNVDDSVVLYINSSNARFHTIERDGGQSPLVGLKNAKDKADADGVVYVQAGTGIRTKVTFPSVSQFKETLGNIAINKAELVFEYVNNPIPADLPPPLYLGLLKLDKDGKVKRVISGTNYQELSLVLDDGYSDAAFSTTGKKYVFDISSYIHSIVYGLEENNGLMVTAPPIANKISVNRSEILSSGVKLKISYTKLK